MFEHLGAEDNVEGAVILGTCEVTGQHKADCGEAVKSGLTVLDPGAIDLGASSARKEIANHRQKSSIAATEVEQLSARVRFYHSPGHRVSFPMAPLQNFVAREKLLA